MEHWMENSCEEESNMLGYNRFILDRFKTDVASLFIIFEKVSTIYEFRF